MFENGTSANGERSAASPCFATCPRLFSPLRLGVKRAAWMISPLKIGALRKNVGRFKKNVGDFSKNVGLFPKNVGDFSENVGVFFSNVGDFLLSLAEHRFSTPLLRTQCSEGDG